MAGRPGDERLHISGSESLVMTHQLRAMHDAILIGVGTLLKDDPMLTVRLVRGRSPRAVVLDSELRTPLGSRLASSELTLITSDSSCLEKRRRAKALEALGVRIISLETESGRVCLEDALCRLKEDFGWQSVMVEGGIQVIASFLARPELVSSLVVTVSPRFLGGLGPAHELQKLSREDFLSMRHMRSCSVGEDLVIYGSPELKGLNGTVNGHANAAKTSLCSSCRMWVEAIDSECDLKVYRTLKEGQEIVALIKGHVAGAEHLPVPLRWIQKRSFK